MIVGNKKFRTKTQLIDACKRILNSSLVGSLLQGEDLPLIRGVLSMHESFEEKTKGLKFDIGVRKCSVNPRNKQFYILREDGTSTDFSYSKAITALNKASKIKEALRNSVIDQVRSYKQEYFKLNEDSKGYVCCESTGLKIKLFESHLDHYPKQFDEIVKEWVDTNNISSDLINMQYGGDDSVCSILDNEVLESFRDYHLKHAAYRVVLNKVNRQREKSARFTF